MWTDAQLIYLIEQAAFEFYGHIMDSCIGSSPAIHERINSLRSPATSHICTDLKKDYRKTEALMTRYNNAMMDVAHKLRARNEQSR
jgi:hypothetical protein